jgi:lysozyme family protein
MAERGSLRAVAEDARALGVNVGNLDALKDAGGGYDRWMPVLVDLIDTLKEQARGGNGQARDLAERADRLTAEIQNEERPRASDDATGEETRALGPKFEQVRDEYRELFEACAVRAEYEGQVAWHLKRIKSRRPDYERVASKVAVPWYFISIVHGLEASFRFDGHLHNGDPLSARTVQVPKGRPPAWNPPNDWDSSAIDALTYQGFAGQKDWSIPRMLYRWEAYNGWGYRNRGINTPYLWSFSNQYLKGKFVKDGVYNADAVSKQCGAAVMLRALLDDGAVAVA